MLRRTHRRKMAELGERWDSMWRAERSGRAEQEKAYEELKRQIGNSSGLHVNRPYREELIQAVTFPVIFSAFVVREFSKRLDFETVLEPLIVEQVVRAIRDAVFGADPSIRKMFRPPR